MWNNADCGMNQVRTELNAEILLVEDNPLNDTVLFDELAQLAAHQIGLRISDDAHDRFVGMLRERAANLGYASLKDYQFFLAERQATEEWEELARIFTCGETFFFRDHGQIDLLRLHLLPELIAQHRNDKILRLWSAGCASGEEVYSLAMLVDMLLPKPDGWNILILGTDIDSEAIARAQRGRYGKWSFRMVPEELQQRFFHLEGKEWVLDERIRRMVTFRVSNLVGEPFPDSASELHGMDMILCRNVFIYFNPAAVYLVAAKFAATLREGGYLLTAHTELIGYPVQELKSRLFVEGVVYQRISDQHLVVRPESQPSLSIATMEWRVPPVVCPSVSIATKVQPATVQTTPPKPTPVVLTDEVLLKEALEHANQAEFDLAELICRKALVVNPLAAAPYFLLAQLAQIKGDFNLAKECLNKAIYLDSRFVAAYLELAALCERADDIPRAQTLRHAALGIVRSMPSNEMIEQYEMTAGALTQWLLKWASEPTEGTFKSDPAKLKS
jgi:chemotaxis protein methyltransferase CheR